MSFIGRSWKGKEPLSKVYWIYGNLLGFVLLTIQQQVSKLSVPNLEQITLLVILIHLIWINVSTWRCAFNVENKKWGYVARAMVVLCIMITIYVFIDRIKSSPVMQRALECRHRILDDVARSGLTKEQYGQLHPNVYEDCVHPPSEGKQ